ncbi:MAG: gamma-glutamyltransferase [Armatimonadetes bacterium]|nr:gamma-glutamyltransferase [Armatimonadota bacterium]
MTGRGVVVARNGVVATSQPLATAVGLHVLQQGGNFVDAALAVSAVLTVVEPYNSHLGGDAFVVLYDAQTRQTHALNASGPAPHAATHERFADGIPLRGMASASVPGLVSAWALLHERYATRDLDELLQPAIRYAQQGFPAGYRYSQVFAANESLLRQFPITWRELMPDGQLPFPGKIVTQPQLGWTLSRIATAGPMDFYQGHIAERIVRHCQHHGGLFTESDLAQPPAEWREPLRTEYRGYTLHAQPPVSQGHILAQMLNLLEGYDLRSLGALSAEVIHLQVEAKKLAFADRHAYLGDPRFVRVPLETLLSKEYAARRRTHIDPHRAADHVTAGELEHDTTYFCVVDRWGNAISFIQSIFHTFGCAEVAEGTGVLFNNRMTGFSLDPNSPNVLEPGKRPVHTLNAYLLTRGEELAFVGGTPGGDVQVQTSTQVLCNLIDFRMNPQEAVEAPRWQHDSEGLKVERRMPMETLQALERKGHRVMLLPEWGQSGAVQVVAVHPESKALLAGSDPRCDGHAAGW